MKKYKEMVEEKDLKERDELSRKLTKAEIDMEEKDVKIKVGLSICTLKF